MPKPFVAFDVDGTIFKSSLAEKLVEHGIADGMFNAEPFNEVYANRLRWQRNNNEGVYQAYVKRLVGTLVTEMAGIEVERFDTVTKNMLKQHVARKFKFPRIVTRALADSHIPIAISGSPDILVRPFLEDMNISFVYGSSFETENGIFTGRARSVGDKALLLKQLVDAGDVKREGSIAVGDTFGDISMLEYSELPIMSNASHTLTTYGEEFDWTKVFETKDQVTILQKGRKDTPLHPATA